MNLDPEENLLDHSLRDLFQDYDLPPAEHKHVWAGVAERIATLPKPRKGLPYRLVVPFTAVMGVAVGWLLPRPAAWQPPAPVAAPVHTVAQAGNAPAAAWLVRPAAQPLRQSNEGLIANPLAKINAVLPAKSVLSHRAHKHTVAVRAATALLVRDAADSRLDKDELENTELVPVAADSRLATAGDDTVPATPMLAALAPAESLPNTVDSASNAPVATPPAAHSAKVVKEDRNDEKILYRKPTHRQPERGSAVRRWFSHLSQTLNHLL